MVRSFIHSNSLLEAVPGAPGLSDISTSLREAASPPIRVFAGSTGGGLKLTCDRAAANPTGTAEHGPFFSYLRCVEWCFCDTGYSNREEHSLAAR